MIITIRFLSAKVAVERASSSVRHETRQKKKVSPKRTNTERLITYRHN